MGCCCKSLALMVVVVTVVVETRAEMTYCESYLTPCVSYLNLTKPPESCCQPLRETVQNQFECICKLYNNPGLVQFLGINVTQLLQLPNNCGIVSNAGLCKKGSSSFSTGAIAGVVVGCVALLIAASATGFTLWRRWKRQGHSFNLPVKGGPQVHLGPLKRFSLRELQNATYGFSNKNILGRGGSGTVYKGYLANGSLVAVKRLKKEHTPGVELQFQTEVNVIGMAEHPNLLRLHGFCMTQTEWLLVYPYMANGSVASCLRERQPLKRPLNWPTRKHIAWGSARGLSYMHDHCNAKIIHRDVKAASILLDEDYKAVVGNFGLAKLMDHKDTHETTAVLGTIGHIAPEYLSSGKVSEKTDIFAYGIMLLELITGQRAFDIARRANDEDIMLLDWVKRLLKENKLEMLIDSDLKNNYVKAEVEQLIQVALICTQSSPTDRPKMSEVLRMLEGDGLVEKWEELEQLEVVCQKVDLEPQWNSERIVDSTRNLQSIELSSPR